MKTYIPLIFLTGLASSSFAANDSTNSSQPAQQSSHSYTDGGRASYEARVTTSPNFAPAPHYQYGWSPSYPISRFNGDYHAYVETQQRIRYFPPNPPALGQTTFTSRENADLDRFAAPLGLTTHVYEVFYAPLSTLLFAEDLSKKRREKLSAYQVNRTALISEIRIKLDSLQNSDAATRERELAALATAQAARLSSLEASAEEIRENLVDGGFFESGSNWNNSREWRLGDNTRWESQIDEIKVMRGYASYQSGLSMPQRYLVREIAMELEDSLAQPTSEISLSAPGPYFYFSPYTARIVLPNDLPDTVTQKINAYRELKASLKQELRDVIYANDRAIFSSKRTAALKDLASKQADSLAELDRLAEEIRRGLEPLSNPAKPPVLPLSKELRNRISNYHRQKAALQTTLITKVNEVRAELPNDRVEFVRSGESYDVAVIANRKSTSEQTAKRNTLVEQLKRFNQEQGHKYTQLASEKATLSKDILAAVNEISGRNASKSINQLLQEFSYSLQKQELWELYRDYETAVLEPGLSPAQRRILFGAALEKLNLPLTN